MPDTNKQGTGNTQRDTGTEEAGREIAGQTDRETTLSETTLSPDNINLIVRLIVFI